jgi:hypothetical protein
MHQNLIAELALYAKSCVPIYRPLIQCGFSPDAMAPGLYLQPLHAACASRLVHAFL